MRIAEDLYMDGFISYPRTDNTVYPALAAARELVSSLVRIPEFSAAAGLLDGELTPTRGKKETTDHPPIYPTQAIYPGALEGPKRRVYELVVRRFLATFSPPMITESTRADIEAGSETYFVRGSVVVDPGYAGIYTYARSADEEIPALEEGQSLDLDGEPWIVDKETQPPVADQPGQADRADGGARPRHQGDPRRHHPEALRPRLRLRATRPSPSETGIAMYKAFKNYVPRDGDAGDDRRARAGDGPDRRRRDHQGRGRRRSAARCSTRPTTELDEQPRGPRRSRSGRGWTRTSILGPCKVCEEAGRKQEDGSPNLLRIIELKGGKRFVGCEGWNRDDPEAPDSCQTRGPLPGRGYELWRLEERCSVCGETPRLKVKAFRGRPWKLCLNDDCPSMVGDAREARRARGREGGPREGEGRGGRTATGDGRRRAGEAARRRPSAAAGGAPKKPAPTTARTKRARSSRR